MQYSTSRKLLIALVIPAALQSQGAGDASALDAQFRKMALSYLDIYARKDTAAYRQMLAPVSAFVSPDHRRESVEERMAEMKKEGPDPFRRSAIDEFHVKSDGKFAVVDFWVSEHVTLGKMLAARGNKGPVVQTHEVVRHFHNLHTYVRLNGRWLLLADAAFQVAGTEWQKPVAVDSLTLEDYVGRYEESPGYIHTITRKGLQLYGQSPGDKEPVRFNAATPDAFYLAGAPFVVVFTRGRDGRVTGFVPELGGRSTVEEGSQTEVAPGLPCDVVTFPLTGARK